MADGSGQDPAADIQDMMGLQGLINPNPYLEFTGQIPMAGYAGAPTNAATGQPIQSFLNAQQQYNAWTPPPQAPGTTLNSNAADPMYGARTGYGGGYLGQVSGGAGGGMNVAGQGLTGGMMVSAPYQSQQTQQQAAPAAAAPQNPINLRQAYLQALANPGPLPTYGAQMQPGSSLTGAPQPSVLKAFLAAHPSGGTSVPGGYSNQSFFNTLNNLQAAKGASA